MSSPRPIKIIVFADFMCAYSYLGNKALRDAIVECSDLPLTFEMEYRAFRLITALPDDVPVDRRTYLINKYGQRYEALAKVVGTMAQSMGLKIVENGQLSQSTRAHRLLAKAYKVGGQELQQTLLQSYFKAYFEEGKDIGNLALLGELAQNAELMTKDETISFLKSDELNDEVEATIAKARANGIQGSPVTIIDGKFKLDGVQTKDTFVQVFKRLGKCCENAVVPGSPCSDASSDGTISPPKSPV
jgi:predicted DsbA family dithiol-disulfide isomerase